MGCAAHRAAGGEGHCPAAAPGPRSCSPGVRLGRAGERRAGTGIISCLAFASRQAKGLCAPLAICSSCILQPPHLAGNVPLNLNDVPSKKLRALCPLGGCLALEKQSGTLVGEKGKMHTEDMCLEWAPNQLSLGDCLRNPKEEGPSKPRDLPHPIQCFPQDLTPSHCPLRPQPTHPPPLHPRLNVSRLQVHKIQNSGQNYTLPHFSVCVAEAGVGISLWKKDAT